MNRLLVDCGQEIVAGALVAAAGLGADLAVFHTVLVVLVALVAAEAAGSGAGFQVACAISESKTVYLEKILPVAYISAIEVEPDAAYQHLNVLLADACLGNQDVQASMHSTSAATSTAAPLGLTSILCRACVMLRVLASLYAG